MSYRVRWCRLDEKDRLISFLREYWRKDHVFVSDPDLLDWQHRGIENYAFAVAEHEESSDFHGVLGVISSSFFSERRLQRNTDLWLALWKVEKALAKSNTLGTDLLDFVLSQLAPRSLGAIGINRSVGRLYELMGWRRMALDQYFVPNHQISRYQLVVPHVLPGCPTPSLRASSSSSPLLSIKEVPASEIRGLSHLAQRAFPLKTIDYLVGRFLEHPRYHYRFFEVSSDSEPRGLFVARKIVVLGAACLRIVDFFGLESLRGGFSDACQVLLEEEGAEYIDLVVGGIGENHLKRLGFIKASSEVYVPHHFEPYEPGYVQVDCAVSAPSGYVVFKADGDLDRPNFKEGHV